MRFTKMQGLGNDYLYVYGEVPDNIIELSKRLSDRHFGAGSDGMIYISPSDKADFMMRIFNADGSEAKMCGNGIRCVGKYVYEKGYTKKTKLLIDTLSGVKTLDLKLKGDRVEAVTVDMGTVKVGGEMYLDLKEGLTDSPDNELICTPVSVGNPHAVFFVESVQAIGLPQIGPLIEHHEAFPGGVNAEFVEVKSKDTLRMRVWERGSGITMACGTGACASAAAAVSKGFCSPDTPITLVLDGGALEITVSADYEVSMTGPAEFVYEGEVDF